MNFSDLQDTYKLHRDAEYIIGTQFYYNVTLETNFNNFNLKITFEIHSKHVPRTEKKTPHYS